MQDVAIRTVALTLLHFLWQGALIGALSAAALRGRLARTAQRRYVICLAALLACVIAPVVTAMLLLQEVGWQGARAPLTTTPSVPLSQLSLADLPGHATAHLPMIDLMSAGVLVWLIGALSVAAYYVVQWFGVDALRRSAFPLRSPEQLLSCAVKLLRQWKGTARVSIMLSHAVTTPIVVGLWRPMIIFPAASVARMSMDDFELILLHEMAHIIRRDTLANALQVVLEILLFYHPVVHWLSRRARAERECACDDFVVTASGSAYRYAQALTTLALTSARSAPLQLGAASGDLLLRLRNLAGDEPEGVAFPRSRAQLLILAILLVFSLWAYAPGGAWWGLANQTEVFTPHDAPAVPREPFGEPFAKPNTVAPGNAMPDSIPVPNVETPPAVEDSARLRRTRVTRWSRTTAPAAESRIDEAAAIQPHQQPGEAVFGEDLNRETPALPTLQRQANAAVTPTAPVDPAIDDKASLARREAPTPTYSPMPEYPVRARLDGIQGSVVATLRVGPDGRPMGLRVEEATPVGVFEGAVRRSMMRWRYNFTGSTAPPPETAVSYRLNFSLAGVSSAITSVCATATASRTCEPQ